METSKFINNIKDISDNTELIQDKKVSKAFLQSQSYLNTISNLTPKEVKINQSVLTTYFSDCKPNRKDKYSKFISSSSVKSHKNIKKNIKNELTTQINSINKTEKKSTTKTNSIFKSMIKNESYRSIESIRSNTSFTEKKLSNMNNMNENTKNTNSLDSKLSPKTLKNINTINNNRVNTKSLTSLNSNKKNSTINSNNTCNSSNSVSNLNLQNLHLTIQLSKKPNKNDSSHSINKKIISNTNTKPKPIIKKLTKFTYSKIKNYCLNVYERIFTNENNEANIEANNEIIETNETIVSPVVIVNENISNDNNVFINNENNTTNIDTKENLKNITTEENTIQVSPSSPSNKKTKNVEINKNIEIINCDSANNTELLKDNQDRKSANYIKFKSMKSTESKLEDYLEDDNLESEYDNQDNESNLEDDNLEADAESENHNLNRSKMISLSSLVTSDQNKQQIFNLLKNVQMLVNKVMFIFKKQIFNYIITGSKQVTKQNINTEKDLNITNTINAATTVTEELPFEISTIYHSEQINVCTYLLNYYILSYKVILILYRLKSLTLTFLDFNTLNYILKFKI